MIYDSHHSDLRLIVTTLRNILVTCDEAIEENCSLWDKQNIEVISKGDSLLVIMKTTATAAAANATAENVCRKYRVQFAAAAGKSAVEQCADCVALLSTYINIAQLSTDQTEHRHQQLPTAASLRQESSSEVVRAPSHKTIAELAAQVFAGGLPEAYHTASCTNLVDDVAALLPLCLSDSNFASFVGQVEQKLKEFIDND